MKDYPEVLSDRLMAFSEKVGVNDLTKFKICLTSEDREKLVQSYFKDGTFILNGVETKYTTVGFGIVPSALQINGVDVSIVCDKNYDASFIKYEA